MKRVAPFARGRRPATAQEIRRSLRPFPADRIVRWIGAGKRRVAACAEPVRMPDGDAGKVVALTWSQTFGRAGQGAPAESGHGQAVLRPAFRSP